MNPVMQNNQEIYDKTTSPFKEADQLIKIIKERYDRIDLDFPLGLDIGCGMGYISDLLAKSLKISQLYAIDSEFGMLEMARTQFQNTSIKFIEEDFSKPMEEFKNIKSLKGKFSFIFSNEYLGGIQNKKVFVDNMMTMTAKNADIYLLFYSPTPLRSECLDKMFKSFNTHDQFMEWKNQFKNAGFKIIDSMIIDCVETVDDYSFRTNVIPVMSQQIRNRIGIWFDFLTNLLYPYFSGVQTFILKSSGQTMHKFPREKFYFRLNKP